MKRLPLGNDWSLLGKLSDVGSGNNSRGNHLGLSVKYWF